MPWIKNSNRRYDDRTTKRYIGKCDIVFRGVGFCAFCDYIINSDDMDDKRMVFGGLNRGCGFCMGGRKEVEGIK